MNARSRAAMAVTSKKEGAASRDQLEHVGGLGLAEVLAARMSFSLAAIAPVTVLRARRPRRYWGGASPCRWRDPWIGAAVGLLAGA